MIIIAAFAIYVIVTRRVAITRNFTITGSNARVYGFALLLLLIPMVFAINFMMRLVLPHEMLTNPVAARLIGIALLGVFAFLLALIFRDRATQPSDPSSTAA
jgi:hypothetical protein